MRRNRIILYVLFVLSLIGITIFGNSTSYTFFYACIGIPVICLLYLLYVFIRFRIYQQIESRWVVKGEATPYNFVLTNEDFITFHSVGVHFYDDNSKVDILAKDVEKRFLPKESLRIDTVLTCKYRGEYQVGVKQVTIKDFLNLFSITYHVPFEMKAVVFPRIVPLYKLNNLSQIESIIQDDYAHKKEEPGVNVHKYQSGESVKSIHWKLSAKQQMLLTREYVGKQNIQIALTVDLSSTGLENEKQIIVEDQIIECSIALINYFCNKNIPLLVKWADSKIKENYLFGGAYFQSFYELFAGVSFQSKLTFNNLIENSSQISDYKNDIWITHGLNEEIYQTALRKIAYINQLFLIVMSDEELGRYQKLSNSKIKIIIVRSNEKIEEVI